MPVESTFTEFGRQVINTFQIIGGIRIVTKNTFKELFTKPFYLGLTHQQITLIGISRFYSSA